MLFEALGERGDLDVAEVAARLEGVFFDVGDGELEQAGRLARGGGEVRGQRSEVRRRRSARGRGRSGDGFGVKLVFEGRA
jgi:hypothetical protein